MSEKKKKEAKRREGMPIEAITTLALQDLDIVVLKMNRYPKSMDFIHFKSMAQLIRTKKGISIFGVLLGPGESMDKLSDLELGAVGLQRLKKITQPAEEKNVGPHHEAQAS